MGKSELEDQLERIFRADSWSMDVLRAVEALGLPDWAIGAGFVRALVWDELTGQGRTTLDDVDVLYFDREHCSESQERTLEERLRATMPGVPWSVKNQARMHLRNQTAAYCSTEDAMRYWLETPTAVAVGIDRNDDFVVSAPYGLSDLFQMIIRPTPKAREKMDQFEARLAEKPWLRIWPNIRVVRSPVEAHRRATRA